MRNIVRYHEVKHYIYMCMNKKRKLCMEETPNKKIRRVHNNDKNRKTKISRNNDGVSI